MHFDPFEEYERGQELRQREERRIARIDDAARSVMSTAKGRRFIAHFLDVLGLEAQTWNADPLEIAAATAKRDAAQVIATYLEALVPDDWDTLRKEKRNDRNDD